MPSSAQNLGQDEPQHMPRVLEHQFMEIGNTNCRPHDAIRSSSNIP